MLIVACYLFVLSICHFQVELLGALCKSGGLVLCSVQFQEPRRIRIGLQI